MNTDGAADVGCTHEVAPSDRLPEFAVAAIRDAVARGVEFTTDGFFIYVRGSRALFPALEPIVHDFKPQLMRLLGVQPKTTPKPQPSIRMSIRNPRLMEQVRRLARPYQCDGIGALYVTTRLPDGTRDRGWLPVTPAPSLRRALAQLLADDAMARSAS